MRKRFAGTLFMLLFSLVLIITCKKSEDQVTDIIVSQVSITGNTVKITGEIKSLSGKNNTEYGICYATQNNPTLTDQVVKSGVPKVGPFTIEIKNLSLNQTYYFKAFIKEGDSYLFDDVRSAFIAPVIPTISTTAITNLSSTTCTSGGNITADGGAAITSRGVCWSINSNPTVADTKTADGTGTGEFTSSLTGLGAGTTYHVRAYATNSVGTAYGSDVTFTTTIVIVLPTVTTANVSAITATTATGGGNVTNDGGGQITARGVCWGTSINPTISGLKSSDATGTGAFTSNLINLSPVTTYHVRAYATNSAGTAYGSDISFSTVCSAPSVASDSPTAINSSSATLNGTINANGSSTTVMFEYGLTSSYGSSITANQSPVTSSTNTQVTANITGLIPGQTYHYRVIASNCGGTINGADQTFTTSCISPTAVVTAASSIGTTTATLNGTVNANGSSTVVTFEYGLTTGYGTVISAAESPLSSSTNSSVSVSISGLMINTIYHYRIKTVSCGGTFYSSDIIFTTLCNSSTATTDPATNILTSSATLNGIVNANGFSSTVSFEYGLTTSYGSSITATQSPVTGSNNTSVSASVTGLTSGTLYHYRTVSITCGGIIYGSDQSFTTACAAPSAATTAASAVGTSTATINGNVNSNGASSTVTFEYGFTTGYGNTATATESPVTGSLSTAVSAALSGLAQNTLYHFRVVTVSCGGTVYGSDMTFTTTCTAPGATTNAASGVVGNGATLNGTINANGVSTTVTFEYGLTTGYGNSVTATQSPVSSSSNTSVSASVTGLTAGTLYHFRVKTVSCGGTVYGGDLTFTTTCTAPTATTNAPTSVATTTAILNGTVNANNASTTVTFEYGTTTGYGSTVTATQSPVNGGANTSVSVSISGLTQGTMYHYRVKAVNCGGTIYGSDQVFGTDVSDVDGNVYNVVVINSVLWMQENLKASRYNDGTNLVQYSDTMSIGISYYHYYANNSTYGNTYGYMYNGYAITGTKEICPSGWHVPTDAEWTALETYLGGTTVAGGHLKQSGTATWSATNSADNTSGFTALGGGYYTNNYYSLGTQSRWWTDTSLKYRAMTNSSTATTSGTGISDNAFYIRCRK